MTKYIKMRRNDFTILKELLSNCNEPILKTVLGYKTQINWNQLQRYLLIALEREYIKFTEDNNYVIS